MRLTWKDGLATAFVGIAVAFYWFWMTGTEVLGLASARAVSTAVLLLGIAGCYTARLHFEAIYGRRQDTRPPKPYVALVSTVGVAALGAAGVALIAGSTVALTVLIIAMIALWAMATIRHFSMHSDRDLTAVR